MLLDPNQSVAFQEIAERLSAKAHDLSESVRNVLLNPPYNTSGYEEQSSAFARKAVDIASAVGRGRSVLVDGKGVLEVEAVQEMLAYLNRAKGGLQKASERYGWEKPEALQGYKPDALRLALEEAALQCEGFIEGHGGPNPSRALKLNIEMLFGQNSEFIHRMSEAYKAVTNDAAIEGTGYDVLRPVVKPYWGRLDDLYKTKIIELRLSPQQVGSLLKTIHTEMKEAAAAKGLATHVEPLLAVIEQAEQLCAEMKQSKGVGRMA